MKFKTIKELYDTVKSGKIDESKLVIIMDNDDTSFYNGETEEDENYDINNEIKVEEANGYYDIEKLYPLLFPKAKVEWC